jgi:hypothetical protein
MEENDSEDIVEANKDNKNETDLEDFVEVPKDKED